MTPKRMHLDVIPKAVDEYHQQLRAFPDQTPEQQLANPVWHIHGGNVPASDMAIPFQMLLNLASVAGAADKEGLWGFIRRYAPEASPETHPALSEMDSAWAERLSRPTEEDAPPEEDWDDTDDDTQGHDAVPQQPGTVPQPIIHHGAGADNPRSSREHWASLVCS